VTPSQKNQTIFHQQYHRSTRSFPLVIIQSESQKEDNLKNIFPPEILSQLNILQIQMNAVAPTNLVSHFVVQK
jgi:hypothetical protein